jgi:light-regulated signal transduction histidine kinase (bacteriophytochrome)
MPPTRRLLNLKSGWMNYSAKNYDSDFCGSLPLHNINLIQPYGYLVILSKPDLRIIQASENISYLLNKPVADIINSDFSSYIAESQQASLKNDFSVDGKIDRAPLALLLKTEQREIDCVAIVHSKPEYLILEIEEQKESNSFIHVYQEVRFAMSAIEAAKSVREACETAATELKKLSGFNKVMLYRFDENWNGTVISEESDEGLESYLGLTFPASDIPKQARELYLKNPYRLIPSRDYAPVRLYPVRNSITNSFLVGLQPSCSSCSTS